MGEGKPSGFRSWIFWLKVAASLFILGWLVQVAWSTDQFARLWHEPKQWGWLPVAIAATAAAHLVGFIRWYWMGNALGLPLTIAESVRLGLIGCFFSLLPLGLVSGDSMRAWYAARHSPGRKAEAVASVFLDRAIGMLTMFLFAALGYWICRATLRESGEELQIRAIQLICQFSLLVSAIGLAGLSFMMLIGRIRRTRPWRAIERLPRVGRIAQRLTGIFMLYRNRYDAILGCFALSLLVNILFAVAIWSVAEFLPGRHPGLADHLVISPISMVANSVPLPGGVGGMEPVLGFLYRGFLAAEAGAGTGPQTPELLVAFVFRFCLLLVAAAGAIAWFTSSQSLRAELQAAKDT